MVEATRVLVVDDDPHLRLAVRRALALDGYHPIEAATGHEAMDALRSGGISLVVLDRMLPDVEGAEICRRIREAGDELPVLMLTAKDALRDRIEGLDSGADDYLVKPFELDELLARVRALLRRHHAMDSEVLRFADVEIDTAAWSARRGARQLSLTPTEFKLLMLLMRNPYRVLTREVILSRVWGYDFGGDDNVLEVYVRYLRNKLEEGGAIRLLQTVRGVGYVLREHA